MMAAAPVEVDHGHVSDQGDVVSCPDFLTCAGAHGCVRAGGGGPRAVDPCAAAAGGGGPGD